MKRQLGPPTAEERGHLFEGWIASVLRAYRDYRGLFEDWHYWAPGKGTEIEVDFVLSRGASRVAIEIKSGRQVPDRALRGLRAIGELKGMRRRLVVYLGDTRMKTHDGIEIFPLSGFLKLLERGDLF